MAIAFLRVSVHTRAKSHSAVAASSYRSGTKLLDERTGITHDYSNRRDVVYTNLLLPPGSDNAYASREFLWNKAEAAEKRRDAQVSKDFIVALPKELTLDLQIELTKRFSQTYFIAEGLPADIAIHDHGDGNPHAHILIPTRRLESHGFSKYKARDLNPNFAKRRITEQEYWCERWRDIQNSFFLENNLDITVDLNHIIPERHQGNIKNGKHYLHDDNQFIKQGRIEVVLDDPEKVLQHLAETHSVFTRREVEKLLFKTFKQHQSPNDYLVLVERIMAHKDIIKLGTNERGHICYTTRTQFKAELKLQRDVLHLMQRNNHQFSQNSQNLALQYQLNEEQSLALDYIATGKDISVVIGRPGTGKSYLLKPVKEYYANNCTLIGASLSGKVAKSLQAETGILSSTIASLTYRLTQNTLKLTNKHVIVIDEAGMVDFNNLALIINKVRESGSKLILIGDPDQLKPIHKGEIFRGIAELTGFIELENIKRQNDLGDRKASLALAHGNIEEALKHYAAKEAILFSNSPEIKIIQDWATSINTTADVKHSIILAHTRKAVLQLNNQARQALYAKDLLGKDELEFNGLAIATGERILFRRNDKDLGVRNGDIGTVKDLSKNSFQVVLDSGETVQVPNTYKAIDYGYALTVHKSQGMTAKNVHALIDNKLWDKHLSFVAMTRHKEALKLYVDRSVYSSLDELKRPLSRVSIKDNIVDWPISYAVRCGLNPDKTLGKVVNTLVDRFIKNDSNYEKLQEKYPLLKEYAELQKKSQYLSGYYKEKMDKKIADVVKNITSNKTVMHAVQQAAEQELKDIAPSVCKKISIALLKNSTKELLKL